VTFPAAGADTARRSMIRTFLIAAQRFMNLCEDLPALAQDLDEVKTSEQFENLLDDLRDLAEANSGGHPLFFTKPMAAALCRVNSCPDCQCEVSWNAKNRLAESTRWVQ
jgi:hypothetical protein